MKWIILFMLLCAQSASLVAKPLEKIEGTYRVTSIESDPEGFFTIKFMASSSKSKFSELTLQSEHVHFGLREGEGIRIRAEVVPQSNSTAEISQVMILLPHVQGYAPVWLLSRHAELRDLKASKFLEMHAPQSDFAVF